MNEEMKMRAAFSTSSTTAMLLLNAILHAPVLSVSSFQSIPSICHKFAKYRFTTSSHFVQRRTTATTTTAIMMSSTSPAAVTKLTDMKNTISVGDYASLFATFSSETGKLVSVPEHLIPESMLEWGEIPSSLETLTSEDIIINDNENVDLERTTITVLPEVGCGIDNLEVTKKLTKFEAKSTRSYNWHHNTHPEREVAAIECRRGQSSLDIETTFQVDSNIDEEDDEMSRRSKRIRLSLSLDVSKQKPVISKLLNLQVERQVSTTSTQGTAWTGPKYNSGGLDMGTVVKNIGNDIVKGDVFAVKRIKGGGDVWDILGDKDVNIKDSLEGLWIQTKDDNVVEVQRTKEEFVGETDTTTLVSLRLPQNILVRYGEVVPTDNNKWGIEVSHFSTINRDDKTYLQRRVVSRKEVLEEGSNNSLGNVSYWIEEKVLD